MPGGPRFDLPETPGQVQVAARHRFPGGLPFGGCSYGFSQDLNFGLGIM